MKRLHENIYLGDNEDFSFVRANWNFKDMSILFCAKEPYHRHFVGYTTRGCPIDSPHYLYYRDNKNHIMALNMVDAEDPKFFSTEMIDGALDFIDTALKNGRRILVICNQGVSRSPSVVLLYLAHRLKIWGEVTPMEAIDEFMQIYPKYEPGKGIYNHILQYWGHYQNGKEV